MASITNATVPSSVVVTEENGGTETLADAPVTSCDQPTASGVPIMMSDNPTGSDALVVLDRPAVSLSIQDPLLQRQRLKTIDWPLSLLQRQVNEDHTTVAEELRQLKYQFHVIPFQHHCRIDLKRFPNLDKVIFVRAEDYPRLAALSLKYCAIQKAKSRRYDQPRSPYEIWHEDSDRIINEAVMSYTQYNRDKPGGFWAASFEEQEAELHWRLDAIPCPHLFPVAVAVSVYKAFGMKKILDISAGWVSQQRQQQRQRQRQCVDVTFEMNCVCFCFSRCRSVCGRLCACLTLNDCRNLCCCCHAPQHQGDRLLAACMVGAEYYGCDPNTAMRPAYDAIIRDHGTPGKQIVKTACFEMDDQNPVDEFPCVADGSGGFDGLLSSPPFWLLESYTNEPTQSILQYPEIDTWIRKFVLKSLFKCNKALAPGANIVLHVSDIISRDKEKHPDVFYVQKMLTVCCDVLKWNYRGCFAYKRCRGDIFVTKNDTLLAQSMFWFQKPT